MFLFISLFYFVEEYVLSNRPLEREFHGVRESFNFRARGGLRDAHQRMLGQLRIRRAQRERPDDFVAQKVAIDYLYRARQLDRELVEKRRIECAPHAGNLQQLGKRELRLGQVLLRHLAQAFLAEERQVHRSRERAERLVGANVGGGFLAADMLLARRERQHKAALTLGIGGLSREPSGHLPHEPIPRSNHAGERSEERRVGKECRSGWSPDR